MSQYIQAALWTQKEYVERGMQLNNALLSKSQSPEKWSAISKTFEETFSQDYKPHMVKALIFYYHALAQQIGHTFQEGTFIIYDGKPIYRFLTHLKKKYMRNSSHLNALAANHNKFWLKKLGKNHFGYDVAMPELNFSTILFNRISEDGDTFYLKPESHGTAHFFDMIMHGITYFCAQGRKFFPQAFGPADRDTDSNERIPQDILKKYLILIKQLESDKEKQQLLRQNALTWGISAMYQGAQQLLKKHPHHSQLQDFIADLEKPDPKKTYLSVRIGSEVILTPHEFALPINQT